MPAELLLPLVAVIGGLLGTLSDLKTKEIPNWINYFMILFGVGGFAILSLLSWSIWPLIYSIGSAVAFYGLSAIMYYGGQWGGGDAKMLIGFGALLPIYPLTLTNWFSPILSFWPFPLTLFLNIILIGGSIGILTILFLIFKHAEKFSDEMQVQIKKHKNWVKSIVLILIIPIISYFFGAAIFIASTIAWGAIALLLLSFLVAKSVENACMIKLLRPDKLTIGDWLAEDIRVNNRVICKPSPTGLSEKEVAKLAKLGSQGKIHNVKIKDGIPFAPSFFLGLITSLVFGDLVFIIIRSFF